MLLFLMLIIKTKRKSMQQFFSFPLNLVKYVWMLMYVRVLFANYFTMAWANSSKAKNKTELFTLCVQPVCVCMRVMS